MGWFEKAGGGGSGQSLTTISPAVSIVLIARMANLKVLRTPASVSDTAKPTAFLASTGRRMVTGTH
jgi:hypothetical protein